MKQSQQVQGVGRWAKRIQKWALGGMVALVAASALALPSAAQAADTNCEGPERLGFLYHDLNYTGKSVRIGKGWTNLVLSSENDNKATSLCLPPRSQMIVYRNSDSMFNASYTFVNNWNEARYIADLRPYKYNQGVGTGATLNDSITMVELFYLD
jgi:opacity protein-like surface antigen